MFWYTGSLEQQAPGSSAPPGHSPTPARPRPGTDPRGSGPAGDRTLPALRRGGRRRPSPGSPSARAPTSPARPTISPGRTSKATSANSPGRVSPSHRQQRLDVRRRRLARRGGKTYSIDRPVIRRITSAVGVARAASPVATRAAVLQHGDPVADRADLLEPVGDVDDGDAGARPGRGSTWNRFSTSSSSSTAEGSSMTISRASRDSARAMLTICLPAADRVPTSRLARDLGVARAGPAVLGPGAGVGRAPREAGPGQLVAEEDVLAPRSAQSTRSSSW